MRKTITIMCILSSLNAQAYTSTDLGMYERTTPALNRTDAYPTIMMESYSKPDTLSQPIQPAFDPLVQNEITLPPQYQYNEGKQYNAN